MSLINHDVVDSW